MFTLENAWTSMSVKPFQVSALVESAKTTLDLLNASVLKAKVWMKITFVKMKMNVQLTIKAKTFVPMVDVSTEILGTFVFAIQATFLLKIKSPVWMQDKDTVFPVMIDNAESHWISKCPGWIAVASMDHPGVKVETVVINALLLDHLKDNLFVQLCLKLSMKSEMLVS